MPVPTRTALWINDPDEWQSFLDAVRAVSRSRQRDRAGDGRFERQCRQVRDLEFVLDDERLEALDDAGFNWDGDRKAQPAPAAPVSAPRAVETKANLDTLRQADLDATVARMYRGDVTVEDLTLLRVFNRNPDVDPVDTWIGYGLEQLTVLQRTVFDAVAAPETDTFAVATWGRELTRAFALGIADERSNRFPELRYAETRQYLRNLGLLAAHIEETGNADIRTSHTATAADGTRVALGTWLDRQRGLLARGELADDRRTALESIGVALKRESSDMRWERHRAALARHVETHGPRVLPSLVVTEPDTGTMHLGAWARRQQDLLETDRLAPARAAAFTQLHIELITSAEASWARGIAAVRQLKGRSARVRINATARVTLPDGDTVQIGNWLRRQQERYLNGDLPEERVEELRALGIGLHTHEAQFARGLAFLKQFVETHGHAEVLTDHQVALGDGRPFGLGRWLHRQRQRYDRGTLPGRRARALQNLGVRLDLRTPEYHWRRGLDALEQYVNRTGTARVRTGHIEFLPNGDAIHLDSWVTYCRVRYRKGRLDDVQVKALRNLGLDLDSKREVDVLFATGLAALDRYIEREGNADVPQAHVETMPDGSRVNLGEFVSTKRKQLRRGELRPDRRAALDARGFTWDLYAERFETGLAHLRDYVASNGHAEVPQHFVAPTSDGTGFQLGLWVMNRRSEMSKGLMREDRERTLRTLGVTSNLFDTRWNRALSEFERYVAERGDPFVPTTYVVRRPGESEVKLGQWCRVQRDLYNRGALDADRAQRLEACGFVWDVLGYKYARGLRALTQFADREGHTNVPKGHRELIDGDSYDLRQWMDIQRRSVREGTLAIDRLQALAALGVTFAADAVRVAGTSTGIGR